MTTHDRHHTRFRPRPLHHTATSYVRYHGITAGGVLALTGWAIVALIQSSATVALLGLVPGVTAILATSYTAHTITRRAEPLVTPISDPRDNRGLPLLPARTAAPVRKIYW